MISLVILAAGWGRRYGGAKQIDSLGPNNESLLDYAVFDAIKIGFDDLLIVTKEDLVPKVLQKFKQPLYRQINCRYCLQKIDDLPQGISAASRVRPWGTAHALYACRDFIDNQFVLINADDFYGQKSFKILYDFLTTQAPDSPAYASIGYKLAHSLSENGAVSRGILEVKNDYLVSITEKFQLQRDCSGAINDQDSLTYSGQELISMNCWGLNQTIFSELDAEFAKFFNNAPDLLKDEFMLPPLLANLIAQQACTVKVFKVADKPFGITHRADSIKVKKTLTRLQLDNIYPQNFVAGSPPRT